MLNRLRQFMYGRYGTDQLQWGLLGAYLVLSLILSGSILRYIALVPLVFFWYRFLSRDIYKRRAENTLFMKKAEPVILYFKRIKSRLQDREHRYYSCPRCKQTLRVPKGRGKITITCPMCRTSIIKKT